MTYSCVADVFCQHATQKPHVVALESEAECVTYAQLWELAGAAACALRARGACSGKLVGLQLPRGSQWYACTVACAVLGVPFVWLSGGATKRQQDFDAEVKRVLRPDLVIVAEDSDDGEESEDSDDGEETEDSEVSHAMELNCKGQDGAPGFQYVVPTLLVV